MTTTALAIIALTFLALSSTNAFAIQFSFDPGSGYNLRQTGSIIPVAIVVIVSFIGAILIVIERRKAKGIWFSNSERMK